jgi:hypothetical protein
MSDLRPDTLVGRKLPAFALWEQLQRRAQPLGLEFCSAFFNGEMTYKAAQEWLAGYGIKVSTTALQGFYNSLDMRLRFASLQAAQNAETAKAELPADIEQATKDRIAQHKFELSFMNLSEQHKLQLIALQQNQDGMKGNFALKKAALDLRRQAEDRLVQKAKLEREKFEFDAAKAALAQAAQLKTISASKLSDVEKIDAARRALFGELPEEVLAEDQKGAKP